MRYIGTVYVERVDQIIEIAASIGYYGGDLTFEATPVDLPIRGYEVKISRAS